MEDSRLRDHNQKEILSGKYGKWTPIFCLNCGTDAGCIAAEWAKQVIYICDLCAEKYGHLPLPEIPLEKLNEIKL